MSKQSTFSTKCQFAKYFTNTLVLRFRFLTKLTLILITASNMYTVQHAVDQNSPSSQIKKPGMNIVVKDKENDLLYFVKFKQATMVPPTTIVEWFQNMEYHRNLIQPYCVIKTEDLQNDSDVSGVQIPDHFKSGLLMEYADNSISLAQWLLLVNHSRNNYSKSRKKIMCPPLSPFSIFQIIQEMLNGVEHLHQNHLIHGNIYEDNVLLVPCLTNLTPWSLKLTNYNNVQCVKNWTWEQQHSAKAEDVRMCLRLCGCLLQLLNGDTTPTNIVENLTTVNEKSQNYNVYNKLVHLQQLVYDVANQNHPVPDVEDLSCLLQNTLIM